MSPRPALQLVRNALAAWVADRAASMGAAIAFYTILSIAPLLLIVIGVAGFFFGEDVASGALLDEMRELVGPHGAEALQAVLASAQRSEHTGVVAMLAGVGTLALGATTVFMEIQEDLNHIWRAEPRKGLSGYLRRRLIAFGVILGTGFLMTVSLVLSAAVTALGEFWHARFGGVEWPVQLANFALWFGVTTLLFGMIYKLLPYRYIAWRDVWVGAAITSLLFALGRHLIGLYLGHAAVASSYGAAGAFVVFVVWVYFSAQIFLLGAELSYQYARSYGSLRAR